MKNLTSFALLTLALTTLTGSFAPKAHAVTVVSAATGTYNNCKKMQALTWLALFPLCTLGEDGQSTVITKEYLEDNGYNSSAVLQDIAILDQIDQTNHTLLNFDMSHIKSWTELQMLLQSIYPSISKFYVDFAWEQISLKRTI